jgi:hypothetical protein
MHKLINYKNLYQRKHVNQILIKEQIFSQLKLRDMLKKWKVYIYHKFQAIFNVRK